MSDGALCRAFNLTVSVKGDINEPCIKALKKWLTKNTKYVYAVIENDTGKAHLHASMFFVDPRDKKKMRENIWDRQVKPFHPTSIGRFAVHIQACPGRKWVDEYLKKDQGVEVLINDMQSLDVLEEYFPSQEIQEKLMDAKEKTVDVFYAVHEVEYKKYLEEKDSPPSTSVLAHKYFLNRMCVKKDMRCIADSRRVHQMAVMLHRYSCDSDELTSLEDNTHTKENMSFDWQAQR